MNKELKEQVSLLLVNEKAFVTVKDKDGNIFDTTVVIQRCEDGALHFVPDPDIELSEKQECHSVNFDDDSTCVKIKSTTLTREKIDRLASLLKNAGLM